MSLGTGQLCYLNQALVMLAFDHNDIKLNVFVFCRETKKMSADKIIHPWADSDSDEWEDETVIHEGRVVVSVDDVTHDHVWNYWQKKKDELLAQQNGRILVLTGCHGSYEGRDGVVDLNNFKANIPSHYSPIVYNKQQTRGFYEKWTKSDYFGVSAEPAEATGIYTSYTDRDGETYYEVTGIKPIPEDEMPQPVGNTKLPNSNYKNHEVLVLDVAFFHKRDEDLVAFIWKFQPTIIIIDWAFSKNGHTDNLLVWSGIKSQLMAKGKGGGEEDNTSLYSILETVKKQNSSTGEVARQVLEAINLNSLERLHQYSKVPCSVKDVVLFILFMTTQNNVLKHAIRNKVSIPVDNFKSYDDISLYIKALLTSGVDETLRAMLFIVGNTKVGKTSTMRTIQRFCQGVPKEDMPFLTDDPDNHEYFETQVLEVIHDVVMEESVDEEVALLDVKNVKMAKFRKKKRNPTVPRKVVVNVYDAGGQKEYFLASALFMKERVTFLVAFDGQDMRMTQVDGEIVPEKYQQTIGTYIDLISQNCKNPCIQLLATKMESMDGSERDLWKDIWKKVADHLNSFSDKTRQIVLASEILNVSAKVISENQIKAIVSRTALLLLSEEITMLPKSGMPKLWTAVTSGNNSHIKVNISELQDKLDQLHKSPAASGDEKSIKLLTELGNICKQQQVLEGQVNVQQEKKTKPATIVLPSSSNEEQEEDISSSIDKGPIWEARQPGSQEARKQGNEAYEIEVLPSQPEVVLSKEMALILRTLDSIGNIIWFQSNPFMKDFIIPVPMHLTV